MSKAGLAIDIIDDDISLCRALSRLLRAAGYGEVRGFHSAEDFLPVLGQGGSSLLILDLRLPGMGGLELLKRLRSLGSRVPAILISSHEGEMARARGMNLEPVAFLPKPFEEAELLTEVRRLGS